MQKYKIWLLVILCNTPLLVSATDDPPQAVDKNPSQTPTDPPQQPEPVTTQQATITLAKELARLTVLQQQAEQVLKELQQIQKQLTTNQALLLFSKSIQHTASPTTQSSTPESTIQHKIILWTEPTLGIEFVHIPSGCFQMGSAGDEPEHISDEVSQHVCVEAFWMSRTEITQMQWWMLTQNNPSRFNGANRPVEQVSWYDAQDFAKKLGSSYRLPTEAEWEYAARAGTTTPFYTGDCINTDQANYDGHYAYNNCSKGKSRKQTLAVKSFAPNAFGLYDMHGNVWEWTCSVYNTDYNGEEQTCLLNRHSDKKRVLRGGSWYDLPTRLRSANRYSRLPRDRSSEVGFRIIRVIDKS